MDEAKSGPQTSKPNGPTNQQPDNDPNSKKDKDEPPIDPPSAPQTDPPSAPPTDPPSAPQTDPPSAPPTDPSSASPSGPPAVQPPKTDPPQQTHSNGVSTKSTTSRLSNGDVEVNIRVKIPKDAQFSINGNAGSPTETVIKGLVDNINQNGGTRKNKTKRSKYTRRRKQ